MGLLPIDEFPFYFFVGDRNKKTKKVSRSLGRRSLGSAFLFLDAKVSFSFLFAMSTTEAVVLLWPHPAPVHHALDRRSKGWGPFPFLSTPANAGPLRLLPPNPEEATTPGAALDDAETRFHVSLEALLDAATEACLDPAHADLLCHGTILQARTGPPPPRPDAAIHDARRRRRRPLRHTV